MNQPDYAELLDRALTRITALKAKLAAQDRGGPVAIVGMASRLPGAETGPAELWHLIDRGEDALDAIPADRWNTDAYVSAGGDPLIASGRGGFVGDLRGFDADFFGISPREARSLDPQQRLLLELAWHALEDAEIAPGAIAGGDAGVFVGISGSDYDALLRERPHEAVDAYAISGTTHSMAAGRLAFTLDLSGPALSVDTACSSSLVALHQACAALHRGECGMAIVGAVNRIVTPTAHIAFSRAGMLSPHGRCAVFDDAADGYVRGEGGAVLVLKPLEKALSDGDRVLACIAGSAVNHDGRSSGLTVPNGPAQDAVIRAALAAAGVGPDDIGYVEAHGTGTALGDPIEVHSLGRVFAGRAEPLPIGSVKANIGHLEAAAGMAGIVKLVLALRARVIPGQAHYRTPNRHIDWDRLDLTVPRDNRAWEGGDRRLAGISSFGFSGTNAHAVIAQAPARDPIDTPSDRPIMLPVSARSEGALAQLCTMHAARLRDLSAQDVAAYCLSAARGRDHFEHRAFASLAGSDDPSALADAIEAAPHARAGSLRIGFVFSGQGTLSPGMGRALDRSEPAFAAALNRCEAARNAGGPTLRAMMWGDATERLARTEQAQVVLVSFQIALVETWRAWGIRPEAVMGHSLGEIAAAYAAGAIELDAAIRFAERRGAAMGRMPDGAMVSIFADEARLRSLDGIDRVELAAVNGPDHFVLSGRAEAIEDVRAAAIARDIFVHPLACDKAFHSDLMEPALSDICDAARDADMSDPDEAVFLSTRTGSAERGVLADPDYWRRQAREPVLFAAAAQAMLARGIDCVVEIGPSATLAGLVRKLPRPPSTIVASVSGTTDTLAPAIGRLYCAGAPIDWSGGTGPRRASDFALPRYPFQRRDHWAGREDVAVEAEVDHAHTIEWIASDAASNHAARGMALESGDLGDIVARGRQGLRDRDIARVLAPYAAFEDRLERLATAFVVKARADLAQGREVVADHRRLDARLHQIMREEGREVPDIAAAEAELAAAFEAFTDGERERVEYRLLSRCAHDLADVLDGTDDALARLFPGGDASDVQALYRDGPVLGALNEVLAGIVADVAAQRDGEAPLRVLEVGAGTGGSTRAVLAALQNRDTDYWFTDVSRLFLERASREFGEAGMTYRPLDAERDFAEQGVPSAGFDIVLAANVLHATSDLGAALRHALSALAPGGVLLLLEGIRPQRWVDLTFGLTEGWWRFADTDLRPDYALLSESDWRVLLDRNGLEEIEIVKPFGDAAQAVIAARRPARPMAETIVAIGSESDEIAAIVANGRAEGGRIITVAAGPDFAWREEEATLDLAETSHWRALFERSEGPVLVLHGGAFGGSDDADAIERASLELIALCQAIAAAPDRLRIALATPADPRHDGYATGETLGAALTCYAFELPAARARWISAEADVAPGVLAAECAADGEARVRLAPGTVRVPRLANRAGEGATPPRIAGDGAWLVTGGLGGAGLETTRWLVSRGARHLVLAGRSCETDERQAAALRDLRERGAEIELVAFDVAEEGETERLIADFGVRYPRLAGVVHAAGVIDPITPLASLDASRLRAVFRPKVQGGLNLHRATADLDLQAFILFSSGASVWGFSGEGHYAAANGYLDALATRRRAAGLVATSINWGFLDVGGMTRDEDNRRMLLDYGVAPVSAKAMHRALDIALGGGVMPLVYANNDWSRLADLFAVRGMDALFHSLHARMEPEKAAPPASSVSVDAEKPVPLSGPALARAGADGFESLVLEHLAIVLGAAPADEGDALDRGFLALGMDSLMAIEFRNRIEASLGLTLPATLIFDHPTPAALAARLAADLSAASDDADARPDRVATISPGSATAPPEQPPEPPPVPATDLIGELRELLDD